MDIYATPLFTARDAARHLQMPESTLDVWISRSSSLEVPLVHIVPAPRGWPRLPFVGVIEAYVLRSLRELKMPMAGIEQAAQMVRKEFDDDYALASQRIATDGLDIFVELADGMVSTANQRPIREVVDHYLRHIAWGDAGRPASLQLQQYPDSAAVVIDPQFGSGRPVLEVTRTPIAAIVDLWQAGEPMSLVAREFDLSRDVVEEICRAAAWVLRRPQPRLGAVDQGQSHPLPRRGVASLGNGRLFCLANGNMTTAHRVDALTNGRRAIERVARRPEAGFWHVHADGRLRRMWP